MATTLLDAIKQSLAAPKQPAVTAPQTDQSSLIAGLGAAKSGKAVGPGTQPQFSTLQEQVAAGQARAAEEAVASEGKQASLALGQAADNQQEQFELEGKQLDERGLQAMDEFTRQSEAILRDFQRNGQQLDFNKQKARMEQLGTNLRLSNQKYVDELQSVGRRARLDNAARFQEELNKAVFADELELFNSDLSFRAILKADDRQFADAMAQMDLDYAMSIAAAQAQQANQTAMWQGIGGLTQAGIMGYGQYKNGAFTSEVDDTPDLSTGSTGDLRASERY